MSRNMVEANTSIFVALDQFCSKRGQVLNNAGSPRWIASIKSEQHFLKTAKVHEVLHFGASRKLAILTYGPKCYLCSVGFSQSQSVDWSEELEMNAAALTIVLAELQPRPLATSVQIRDVVEWSDKISDPGYAGHNVESLARLYPDIRLYALDGDVSSQSWNILFKACVDECEFGESWIEGSLAKTLRTMCELSPVKIPYKVLCRSIFDEDRSSFFLALYRCLEALYAYSSSFSLIQALGISSSWEDVATVLEDKLGWHPREESSLTKILKFASSADLTRVLQALPLSTDSNDIDVKVSVASKSIYRLRNSIVHYRPTHHKLDLNSIDWIEICEPMVGIIVDVYEAVFNPREQYVIPDDNRQHM